MLNLCRHSIKHVKKAQSISFKIGIGFFVDTDDGIMTSSNGNIFHFAGLLWEESTWGSPVDSPHRGQYRKASIFFMCALTNGWVNNRNAGNLRRNDAHYGVTVMVQPKFLTQYIAMYAGDRQGKYKGHKWCQEDGRNDVEVAEETRAPAQYKLIGDIHVRYGTAMVKMYISFRVGWVKIPGMMRYIIGEVDIRWTL